MTWPGEYQSLDQTRLPARPLHLAIGMFDGVHLGHRAVIGAAVEAARRDGGIAAALTFWPHPSVLFRPQDPTRMIQDPATKVRMLRALGLEAVTLQPFTAEFARIAADDFLPWLRGRLPTLAGVYVGENFRFGEGRRGDIGLLASSARDLGLRFFSAPRVCVGGEPVSSTAVRALLEAGDVAAANLRLGYNYFAAGAVQPGKRLGRGLGFPTLNLPWSPALRPRFGVYVVRVIGSKHPAPLPGVANYGLRPTVEQTTEPRLEAHVLGACPIEAGEDITVEWLRFLRPEMKFAGLPELQAQIGRDRDAAAADFSLR